ncbi:hypothetical protein KQY30_13065 [Streptomyces sp. GMY02]|uniref:hypothetical protein n=1 Tax=Streptomyces sp. GMY02 TaxID=1333528 RepID=UPI001C2B9B85|nr:hypothetical protein [Streptomyces sp. GMY02]QXE35062.1 hypothetical protein KQY30_13065 [Streptomyces sp. GMY02]
MARHTASPSTRRALLRAGLTVTAAGAALGLGGAAAQASSAPDNDSQLAAAGTASTQALTGALTHSTTGALAPITKLRLNPLSGTGVDPLDNAVGTQVADFKPVSTAPLTAPLTKGTGSLQGFPVVGPLLGALLPSQG